MGKEGVSMAISKKIGTTILSILLLLGFGAAAPNMALAKHGHGKHYKYIYYPASQIYYSPARGGYYYPYAGGWRYGTVVPSGIVLGNGISINLGGPTPYVYHPTVIQQYPAVVVVP